MHGQDCSLLVAFLIGGQYHLVYNEGKEIDGNILPASMSKVSNLRNALGAEEYNEIEVQATCCHERAHAHTGNLHFDGGLAISSSREGL